MFVDVCNPIIVNGQVSQFEPTDEDKARPILGEKGDFWDDQKVQRAPQYDTDFMAWSRTARLQSLVDTTGFNLCIYVNINL